MSAGPGSAARLGQVGLARRDAGVGEVGEHAVDAGTEVRQVLRDRIAVVQAGDVGQDKWEEVDLIVKGGNYGWSGREGFHDYNKNVKLSGKALDPVIEYPHNAGLAGECKFPDHSPGQSITGGYVYRGKAMPPLQGAYIYADFQNGTIWGLKYEGGRVTARGTLSKENGGRQIASFAEDADGEIYVLAFDSKIYQVTLKQ